MPNTAGPAPRLSATANPPGALRPSKRAPAPSKPSTPGTARASAAPPPAPLQRPGQPRAGAAPRGTSASDRLGPGIESHGAGSQRIADPHPGDVAAGRHAGRAGEPQPRPGGDPPAEQLVLGRDRFDQP